MPLRTTVPVAKDEMRLLHPASGATSPTLVGETTLSSVTSIVTTGTWKSAARAWEVIETIAFRYWPRRRHGCSLAAQSPAFLTVSPGPPWREVKATVLTIRPTTNSSPIAQMFAGSTASEYEAWWEN
jgi:hypothetical protein